MTYQVSTYGTLSPKIEELSFKIGGRIARFELPLALGNTMFKALAIVVIGGLTTSTFLTLLCVPVLFSLVTGESKPVQVTQRWTSGPTGKGH